MTMERRIADEDDTLDRPHVEVTVDTMPIFARGTREMDPRLIRQSPAEVGPRSLENYLEQIVHDLKAPLATMALEITLLDHRLVGGDAVDVRPILARLMQNVDFLDRMVHDLLDGWAPETLRKIRRSTDLRALVQAAIVRSIPTSEHRRVRLDAPRSVILQLDDLRIERVVANLLSNALKFSPARSAIVVRLDVHRDRCCVSVRDSGPGVTPAEAGFIFDKYRRTHSSRLYQGSGLGLWVSRKIVEDHGGTMGVDSVPGGGSRFFFELALSAQP